MYIIYIYYICICNYIIDDIYDLCTKYYNSYRSYGMLLMILSTMHTKIIGIKLLLHQPLLCYQVFGQFSQKPFFSADYLLIMIHRFCLVIYKFAIRL